MGKLLKRFVLLFAESHVEHPRRRIRPADDRIDWVGLGRVSLLLEAPTHRWAALISGLCAALTLAVGMGTAPYVATIGACVFGWIRATVRKKIPSAAIA